MRIATAVLIRDTVPGWPEPAMRDRVPLGRVYRVDLDSEQIAPVRNLDHPEWGAVDVRVIVDVDAGGLVPVDCVRIDS